MPNVKRLRVLTDFAVHVISKTCILNSLIKDTDTGEEKRIGEVPTEAC